MANVWVSAAVAIINSIQAGGLNEDDHIAVIAETLVDGDFVRLPMGLFVLDTSQESIQPNNNEVWQATGADVVLHMFEQTVSQPYTLPRGTAYVNAITSFIQAVGLISDIPFSAAVTTSDQVWPIGTPYGQMANDLLEGINYYDMWADPQGVIRSSLRPNPAVTIADVVYSTRSEPRMIRPPEFKRSKQRARFLNQVIATIQNPSQLPGSVLLTNADPDSEISTVRKKAVTSDSMNVDRCPNRDTIAAVGTYMLRDASCKAQGAALITHFDPRRTAHEYYDVTVDNAEVATHWRVEGWGFNCKVGDPMTHQIGRSTQVDVTRVDMVITTVNPGDGLVNRSTIDSGIPPGPPIITKEGWT